MVAAQRGYRCIFVMPDKMSREKIALLRAFGAEVVVCPTEVEPEDPRSLLLGLARASPRRRPGAFNPNQYANPANPQAHYDTTGPGDLGAARRRARRARHGRRHGRHGHRARGATSRSASPTCRSSAPTRSARSTRASRCTRTSSRASARTSGRRRSTATIVDRWIRVSDRDAFAAHAPRGARGGRS